MGCPRRLFCFLFALAGIASLPTPSFAEEIRFPTVRPKGSIMEKSLALRLTAQGGYNDGWIVWGWDGKGTRFHALFAVTRVGLGYSFGVHISLHTPKGYFSRMEQYSKDQVAWDEKKLFLRVDGRHEIRIYRQEGRMKIRFGEWGCDLEFAIQMPGFHFYGGELGWGSRRWSGITWGPRLSLTGTIRAKGTTYPFEGKGYADHSWQTIASHQMARRWYAMRGMDKDWTILASHLLPTRSWSPQSLPSVAVAYKGRWLFQGDHGLVLQTSQIETDPKTRYQVPRRVVFAGKDREGRHLRLEIHHKRLYEKLDILESMSGFLRFMIRSFFSKPYLFRYESTAVLTITTKAGVESKTLPALAEWSFVNP